ncbi:hypothetical protein MIND_01228700 [Mycena indigotica]|uniref:Uncharacterized protein n=1 Tax=Mycena indigotica TaxID=2126181 RepID=A0A8H6VXQ6_9AGAR|nr:uncharacterized protein MIND_01228700 [Mycena indigotica]KAF7292029.1 hypothetical protein MIND_01228700 [Mycena indigotica]
MAPRSRSFSVSLGLPAPLLSLVLAVLFLVSSVAALPGSCLLMNPDQLQSIPGWMTLQHAVETGYGTSPYKIVTNDRQFPNKPASICGGVAQGWVWFEYHARVQGHYKWSFKIEDILLTPEERRLPDVQRKRYPAKLRREADFTDL